MLDDVHDTACRPSLGVGGADDERAEPSVDHCSGTHGAWLERYHERAVVKSPVANLGSRITKGEYLGMSCWIAGQLAFIVAGSDDFVVADDHGANGNIVVGEGSARLAKRKVHEVLVIATDAVTRR